MQSIKENQQLVGLFDDETRMDMLSVTLMIQKIALLNSDLAFLCNSKDATRFLIIYSLASENVTQLNLKMSRCAKVGGKSSH